MNRWVQITIGLISTVVLCHLHSSQASAQTEKPLPVLQPGLVAVGNQVEVWLADSRTPLSSVPYVPPPTAIPMPPVATSPSPPPIQRPAAAPVQIPMPDRTAVPSPSGQPPNPKAATALPQVPPDPALALRQLLTTNACRGCNLRGVNLQDASLLNADLTGADLSTANLQNADLRGAKLDQANLSGTNLSGTIMPDGTLHP